MQKCQHQNKNLHKVDRVAFLICLIFFQPKHYPKRGLHSPQSWGTYQAPDLHMESGPSEGREDISTSELCSGAMVNYCSHQSFALLWWDLLNLLQKQLHTAAPRLAPITETISKGGFAQATEATDDWACVYPATSAGQDLGLGTS